MQGRATVEATSRHAQRFIGAGAQSGAYRVLGRLGLNVSVLGFGCYRAAAGNRDHEAALRLALDQGCNLIDTSTNYGNGAGESIVGNVLNAGEREAVVVVSKVGYVQGAAMTLARERAAAGDRFPDMVEYTKDCWHCIHPAFIADQLGRSLARTGLDTLDVYLLHNPEYYLMDAAKRGGPPLAERRDEFYERVRRAFEHLETEVAAGRIAAYGVSSNTFGAAADDPTSTSLARMVALAESVSTDHHFAVAQLPMNLFEGGPALEPDAAGDTALDVAVRERVAVLVNRPINAITANALTRLADSPVIDVGVTVEQQRDVVVALEEEVDNQFIVGGNELVEVSYRIPGMAQWQQLEQRVVVPQLTQQAQTLRGRLEGEELARFETWVKRYLAEVRTLLTAIRNACARRTNAQNQGIHELLGEHLPQHMLSESMSRKAIATLVNTRGVTCVLNGMRRTEYVQDSMGVMELLPFPVSAELYEAFRERLEHAARGE